jgi:dethiobiotin synthetase
MRPIFITGIGTDAGKTIVSAIITLALSADYWKPIQAGLEPETDSEFIGNVLRGTDSIIFPEVYKFRLAASPHLASREEGIQVNLEKISNQLPVTHSLLVIEGAGGLMVPLNESEFVIDLIEKLNVRVILVSRNYLGSINHSLLTAAMCRQRKLDVKGWIFNGDYGEYAGDISRWTGYPVIAKIPEFKEINAEVLHDQAIRLQGSLKKILEKSEI